LAGGARDLLQPVQKKARGTWEHAMSSVDILMAVCMHVNSVQQLAMLCATSKALKAYLYSEEGGRIWLNVARRICGEECWSATDHVKDGRYEAMVRLCPWLGEKRVKHFEQTVDSTVYSALFRDRPIGALAMSERMSMAEKDIYNYVSTVVLHPAFKKMVALNSPDTKFFMVGSVKMVHGGVVAVHLLDRKSSNRNDSIAFFATGDFRLLKYMHKVCHDYMYVHFLCGKMVLCPRLYGYEMECYSPSVSNKVPALQDRSESMFALLSDALKVDIYPCDRFSYPPWDNTEHHLEYENTFTVDLDSYAVLFPEWKMSKWPGIDLFLKK
jgi:hypothetical protein